MNPELIEFECPNCGASFKTRAENGGKRSRCGKCKEVIKVPSVLDLPYQPDDSAKSADNPQEDIDFSFAEDIESMLKRAAEEKQRAEKQKEEMVLPPVIGENNPSANVAAETSRPEAPRRKPQKPSQPPRPQIVVPNEFLPEKARLKKEIKKRNEEEEALTEAARELDGDVGEIDEDIVLVPLDTPDLVDEDVGGDELLAQVDALGEDLVELPAEEDLSPIKIDGISGDVDELYGVTCTICDTRIHVTPGQVGSLVDCPVCYSKVKVTPAKKSLNRPDWMGPQPGFDDDGKLKRAPDQAAAEIAGDKAEDPEELQLNDSGFQSNPDRHFDFVVDKSKRKKHSADDLAPELQLAPEPEPKKPVANTHSETDEKESLSAQPTDPEPSLELADVEPVDLVSEGDLVEESDESDDMEMEFEDELKLGDLVERPKSDLVAEIGLPNVDQDLLTPVKDSEDLTESISQDHTQDELNVELVEIREGPESKPIDSEATVEYLPKKAKPNRQKERTPKRNPNKAHPASKHSDGERVQSEQAAVEQSSQKRLPSAKIRSAKKRGSSSRRERFLQSEAQKESDDKQPVSVHADEPMEPLTYESMKDLIVSAISSPAIIIRTIPAVLLLTVGVYLYNLYEGTLGDDAETGFVAAAATIVYGLGFLSVYGLGTCLLWYVGSFIFRDTARGFKKIESFSVQSFEEIQGTFMLFAFSMMVAGAPFLMFASFISMPARFLIAPVFLIVAWFNQNPFIGVAFEPFLTFKTEGNDWQIFYVTAFCCALVATIGGLLFKVPYCGFIGAILVALTTLTFAAAVGWHCGRMIKRLEQMEVEE